MREVHGTIRGDQDIEEKYTLWGTLYGMMRVHDGGKVYIRGTVFGDVIVEFGGRVHIFGQVSGGLTIYRGTKVIVSGIVQGNAVNEGGRLYVDRDGSILGRIKTNHGETHVEPKVTLGEDGVDDLM